MTAVYAPPVATDRVPEPGDLLHIGADASRQFAGDRALLMRVRSVNTKAWEGWCWLFGYVCGLDGEAYTSREVYVRIAGLRPVDLDEHRALFLDLPESEGDS